MDKSNIGVFGHSFGGLTSVYAAYFNKKVKSCFVLGPVLKVLYILTSMENFKLEKQNKSMKNMINNK